MAMVEADLLCQTCIYMGEHSYSVTGTMIIVQTIDSIPYGRVRRVYYLAMSRLISITIASSLQLVRPGLILSAM